MAKPFLLVQLTMPVYLIPGNHDERTALRNAFPDHAYLRQSPDLVNYAIEEHPLRIIGFDTTVPGKSGGLASEDRLAWLEAKLTEQPAYGLHAFTPETGVVSHTAFVGSFAGPYPFYENGKLID